MPSFKTQLHLPDTEAIESTEFSQFPIDRFECLFLAIGPFRDEPDLTKILDEVLTAFALYAYHAWLSLYQSRLGARLSQNKLKENAKKAWLNALNREEFQHIRPQVKTHVTNLKMHYFFKVISMATLRVDTTSQWDLWYTSYDSVRWLPFILSARRWLLACLAHPGMRIEPTQIAASRLYFDRMQGTNKVDQQKHCDYGQQLQDRLLGGLGLWPGLTRVLRSLLPPPGTPWCDSHEKDVSEAMMFFLRLAYSVHTAVMHKRNPETHFYISPEEVILCSEVAFAEDVNAHPLISSMSLELSEALAGSNFLGNWNFVQHFVFPNLREPHTEFFFLYRWIMAAACHADVDPSGALKSVLAKRFDLSSLEHIPRLTAREKNSNDLNEFVRLYQGDLEIRNLRLRGWESDGKASFDARQREARFMLAERSSQLWDALPADADHDVDPLRDFDLSSIPPAPALSGLAPFTRAVVSPAADDECGICKDDFEDVPGISPNICHHTYHLDCLSHWFEHQRGESVYRCCLCTRVMCTQMDLHGPTGPFWLNPLNESYEYTVFRRVFWVNLDEAERR